MVFRYSLELQEMLLEAQDTPPKKAVSGTLKLLAACAHRRPRALQNKKACIAYWLFLLLHNFRVYNSL
jgi:hypothetical protein